MMGVMFTTLMWSGILSASSNTIMCPLHVGKAFGRKSVERIDDLVNGARHFRGRLIRLQVLKDEDPACAFPQFGRLVPGYVPAIRKQNIDLSRLAFTSDGRLHLNACDPP